MAKPEDLKGGAQALGVGGNKKKTHSEPGLDASVMKTMTDVKLIMTKHETREMWEAKTANDLKVIEYLAKGIRSGVERLENVVEPRKNALLARQALIKNNFGHITQEMVENHKIWREYVARMLKAKSVAPTALNWLDMLLDDWGKRKEALKEFWDRLEKKKPYEDKDFHSIVAQVISLFARQEFLQREFLKTEKDYEVLSEQPPTWLEW